MSFAYDIIPSHFLARVVFSNTVTGGDVLKAVSEVFADAAWQPGMNVLWNCQGIKELVIDMMAIDKLAVLSRDMAPRSGPGKTAIFVSRDLDYSIAALIGARRQSTAREFRVFRSLEEALEWLGVDGLPVHE